MFKWKNILLFILLASFAFAVGVRARIHNIETPPRRDAARQAQPAAEDPAGPPGDPMPERLDIAGRINVLVLGEDNVEGSRRSDTILLATLDVDKENIRVLSVPRDTRMLVPRYGNQKINHAYAYGGSELVRETLQRFLGIPVSYYVKIDYDNFPKLVDLVGGVDIFVGKEMHYVDKRGKLEINIPKGKQRMNGETALKYVRFRHDALGDIGRVQRQQQFMKAMIQRMYEPENLLRFPAIMTEVSKTVTTDISPSMIFQLGNFARRLDKQTDKIFFMMLPGTASIIDKLSYWVSDRRDVEPFLTADVDQLKEMTAKAREQLARNRNQLNAITVADDYSADSPDGMKREEPKQQGGSPAVADERPKDISEIIASIPEPVAVLNGTGKNGLGNVVAAHLQKMGVDVKHVSNAKHFDYRTSNVIYPAAPTEKNKLAATLLAQLCGISSSLTLPNKQATYPSLVVGHDYELLLKRLEASYVQLQ
jgi:LCP family protein required for cell wall assembly